MIHVRMLGAVELTLDGGPPPPQLLWRKNLALLVYLLRQGGRPAARERLLALLWAEKPEPQARHSLNEALRTLRRAVGESRLETDGEQVRLLAGAASSDLEQFEGHLAAGRLAEAIGLIGGAFLEGLTVPGASDFQDWLDAERKLWRDRSVEVLIRQAGVLEGRGQYREAAALARIALTLDPLAEPSLLILLRGLALSGGRVEALKEADDFAARLRQQLGATLSAEARGLIGRIRDDRLQRATQAEAGAEFQRRFPLVARVEPMGRLVAVWREVRDHRRAGLTLVEGEAGVGKSRLLEELAEVARLDGAIVAWARVVERDRDQPDATLWGLARGGLLQAPGAAGAMPSALATLAERLPEWRDRFPQASGPVLGIADALEEVVRAVALESAVLLVVDDAQRADRASLLGLESLLRGAAGAPVLLAMSSEPHPPREEIDQLRSRAGRELAAGVVTLAPLDVEAIGQLARAALPRYSDWDIGRVARRVLVDSAGLPLLVVELLHGVALGMDLQGLEAAWPEPMRTLSQTLPGGLPDAVVGAIRVGFRRLTSDAQQVLAAAAVLGDRMTADVLGRACELDGDAIHRALDTLEWQRWLSADARGYTFVARLAREVVARDMVTKGQRQRILALAGGRGATE